MSHRRFCFCYCPIFSSWMSNKCMATLENRKVQLEILGGWQAPGNIRAPAQRQELTRAPHWVHHKYVLSVMRSLPAKHAADYVQSSPLSQSTMLGPHLIPACWDSGEECQKGKLATKPQSSLQTDCVSAFDRESSWKDTELEEVISSL